MERPRLRPLNAFTVEHNGQKLLHLDDPSRMSEGVTLQPMAVAILQLCDGETTRDEICAEFSRRYGVLGRDKLDKLLEQLDQALLLDSDHFRQHSAQVFAEFARSTVRKPFFAGTSYPADAAALTALLDGFFDPPRGPGRPDGSTTPLPRAVVAPHIDFQRGGPVYAWAYRRLAEAETLPELVVVFGTDHSGSDHPFILTRKHFETPLGVMETDVALVDALTARVRERLGGPASDALFRDEHHHRHEHSLEFQMVWLRHAWRERAGQVKVLPILCGSLRAHIEGSTDPGNDREIVALFDELRQLTDGKRVLWLAGADLAHVGPRFNDPEPLDEADRGSLERRDQETLSAAASGDAAAWFQEIRRERDCRNVCGLSPIYALLSVGKPGVGKLLAYGQCPADERGGSLVSIASLVHPAA
jgi:AmmeMemoRadiSam system protein B